MRLSVKVEHNDGKVRYEVTDLDTGKPIDRVIGLKMVCDGIEGFLLTIEIIPEMVEIVTDEATIVEGEHGG